MVGRYAASAAGQTPVILGAMRRTVLGVAMFAVGAAVSSSTASGRTATAAERSACEARLQERIDVIDSKLRAGYSAQEGERLKERRRKLEAERANCRQVKSLVR
jgi:uncharacterized protein